MAEHYSSEDSTKTCMAEYNDARENNLVSEFSPRISHRPIVMLKM